MGFKGTMVSLILVGIAVLGLLNFGIGFANDNNTNISIVNDSRISDLDSSLNSNLQQSSTNNNNSLTALADSDVSQGDSLLFDVIPQVWKTISNVPVVLYQVTVGFAFDILLGGDSNSEFAIVIGALSGILVLVILLGVWKMVRTGDSE